MPDNRSCIDLDSGPTGCGGHGCSCQYCWAPTPLSDEVEVETRLGTLRGVRWGDGEVFYGVRYAAQPQRFAPSQLTSETWSGVKDATQSAAACWFPKEWPCFSNTWPNGCGYEVGQYPMSEDCLFLDVYRPWQRKDFLPVMVWAHGGSMVQFDSRQNFTQLSAKENLVIVNVNYREGPLGFLSLPEFRKRLHGGAGGMNGQHDVIVALKWVQEHVMAFGGDPARVTLAGASAGSLSTCSLVVSPLARGLFHQAILESGSCLGPWGPGTTDQGFQVTERFMRAVNASTLEDLYSLPTEYFMWSPWTDGYDLEFPGYWVDGWVLPDRPGTLLRQRDTWNVDAVLLGGTSRDGVATPGSYVPDDVFPLNGSAYENAVRKHWVRRNATGGVLPVVRTLPEEDVAERVLRAYPLKDFGGDAAAAFISADGQYNVNCAARVLAEVGTRAGKDMFLYNFAQGPVAGLQPIDNSSVTVTRGWAGHIAEQAFFLGDGCAGDLCESYWSDLDRRLAADVVAYWGNFVRCGAPSASLRRPDGSDLPEWPQYGIEGNAMRLEVTEDEGQFVVPWFGYNDKADPEVKCWLWDAITRNYTDINASETVPWTMLIWL